MSRFDFKRRWNFETGSRLVTSDDLNELRDEHSATYVRRTAPTIILFGDSRTADCTADDGTNKFSTNLSWWDHGQFVSKGGPSFEVIANKGVAGNTTTQMLARFQADVLNLNPSYMTFWGGTNDQFTTTAEVDATFGRVKQMLDQAWNAGIYVFLISETTKTVGGTGYPPLVHYYNELLRNYAAGRTGIEFWDFNAILTDPTNANGYPRADLLRDGIHLNAKGASTLGKLVVAPRLERFGSKTAVLVSSVTDSQATNPASRNIVTNPLMQGTTGTKVAGHTGTVPDNWSSTGTHTVTFSTPARADGIGNDIQAAITAAGAGTTWLNGTVPAARVIPGRTYVVECALTLENPVGLWRAATTLQATIGGVSRTYGAGSQVQNPVAGDGLIGMDMVIRSQKFTIPAGVTVTAASFLLALNFTAAGSATVRLGRVSVKHVD